MRQIGCLLARGTHGKAGLLAILGAASSLASLSVTLFTSFISLAPTVARADPVISTHPRLLLSAADRTRLLAKKDANDPGWQALKTRADTLATYTIHPYKSARRGDAPAGTIYYTYQGEGWLDATLPLAFAWQMTADTRYSSKLIQLAQEMIRAQSDPDNNPPIGIPPIQPDNYYPSRNLASSLAFIYDFCYDQLSAPLKSQMVTLMNQYYDDVKVNGYQAQNYSYAADGNFFGGHLYGVALMGYASFGDNARAQEMIEWARIRFDGTPGPTLTPARVPAAWRTQVFDGGLRPFVALDVNGPNITGNPFKGGFDYQGWSYGSEEFGRMIEYVLIVKSATGEDLFTPHMDWFSQILRAEKQALFPNRFLIDPTGDWGGSQGAVISKGLPTQLAFVLAGTADGPGAQHFAYSTIAASTIPDVQVYSAPEWVEFFFSDVSRPSTELVLPPYYTGFAPNYPQGAASPGGTNGAIPYFIMRSDWSPSATWASVQMGTQYWGDHQHFAAGHLFLARGSDHLLVSASNWKTEVGLDGKPIYGRSGVIGSSLDYSDESSLNNTLYFDDFGDFQSTNQTASGGQSIYGIDQVVADELNQDFSYVRSDLSTAYNRAGDPSDTPNRKLEFFYRNFLYLRASNVFVVYDQVKAQVSSNPKGAYKKHIRWHLPNTPAITGRIAQLNYGQSRLFIDTVLPANANLKVVDEWTNPDPCDGSDPGCVPFGLANAGTFRIEVRDPLNPLFVPFLTVLQPGSNTSTAPTNTQVASLDGKMIGVDIAQAGGAHNIVLFNDQPGQVPAPITSTSYNLPGPGPVVHTLLGVVPNALYSVVVANGVVRVDQSASGDKTASPSGALHFGQDAPGQPTLSINDVSVVEGSSGSSNGTFSVTLSAASSVAVTVSYATADGSATAGSDYTSTSGTLTFTPGQKSRTVSVPVLGDTTTEPDETLFVDLSGASNATVAKARGTGTITDDDGPSALSHVSIDDRTVAEGAATSAGFRVFLSAPTSQTVTVAWTTADGTASAGSDYQSKSGVVTFTPGRTQHSVYVPIVTDSTAEGAETFFVNLGTVTSALVGDGQGTATILDPPAAAKTAMYRAYSRQTDYHFFTTDVASKAFAVNVLGFGDESNPVPFYVWNAQQSGSLPLFRMYNPNLGRHYYTADAPSRDALMDLGMVFEKDEGFVYPLGPTPPAGTTELFRLYNNNTGSHLFTASAAQKDGVLQLFPGTWVQHTSVGFVYTAP